MMWENRAPKSHEILMFVCRQKDAKQCCDATKLDCTHCAGCSIVVSQHCLLGLYTLKNIQDFSRTFSKFAGQNYTNQGQIFM